MLLSFLLVLMLLFRSHTSAFDYETHISARWLFIAQSINTLHLTSSARKKMRADFHFPMPVRVSASCLMFMYMCEGTRVRAFERAFNLHSFDFVCYKSFVIFNLMKRCYCRCRCCCWWWCCDMAMLIWVFSFDAHVSCAMAFSLLKCVNSLLFASLDL